MQFAKDSFFLALQQRLAALNPARTVTVNGTTVPAILVVENLPPSFAIPQPNTFYIEWGAASVLLGHARSGALMSVGAAITYYSLGTVESMVDRGRLLGELDSELLRICQPASTEKLDYTESPTADLGTGVSWSQPAFADRSLSGKAESSGDGRVERRVGLNLYFQSEVTLS